MANIIISRQENSKNGETVQGVASKPNKNVSNKAQCMQLLCQIHQIKVVSKTMVSDNEQDDQDKCCICKRIVPPFTMRKM